MKNINRDRDFQELQARWQKLSPGSTARWGKMNAAQVIVHCTDPLREAMGLRPTRDLSTFFFRSIGKYFALYGPEWPKGKFPTSPDYDQEKKGTPLTTFENDRDLLLKLMSNMKSQPEWFKFQKHPAFGYLTRKEWGILTYRHMDHHLRQFGI